MNLRSLLLVASYIVALAFPALAGAQVQIRAGVTVGTPPPPPVVVVQPQPQVVVVAPPPQPVYVVRPRRPRVVVVESHRTIVIERGRGRHGGRGRRHHRDR